MSEKLRSIKNPFPTDPSVPLTDYDVKRGNIYDPQLRDFAILARLKNASGTVGPGSGTKYITTTLDPNIVFDQKILIIPDGSVVTSIEISTPDPVVSPGPPTGLDIEVLDGLTLLQPPGYPNLSITPIYPTWEQLVLKPSVMDRTTISGGIRPFLSPYTVGTTGGPVMIRIHYIEP